MSPARPVLRVGLTGGIASGKTTVAGMLAELGAFVIDADRLAHELMSPGGPAYAQVVARFGSEILAEDGSIDRERLGSQVFGSAEALGALNTIVHPRVSAEVDRRIEQFRLEGCGEIAVLDAALLVETGRYRDFDRLIVTCCSRETQRRRLIERSGMSASIADARIDAQAPLKAKLAVADYVIDTEVSLQETRDQCQRVFRALQRDLRNRDSG